MQLNGFFDGLFCRFMLLESGSVQIGMKFWFKPVWLPVEDNEFCLDEVVDHDPSLRNKTEIDSHKIYHKNQILLYCQIAHFDDYVSGPILLVFVAVNMR